jgi:hypothetical protein
LQQVSADERQSLLASCGLTGSQVEDVETMLSGAHDCLEFCCADLLMCQLWTGCADCQVCCMSAVASLPAEDVAGRDTSSLAFCSRVPLYLALICQCALSACSHAHTVGVRGVRGGGRGGEAACHVLSFHPIRFKPQPHHALSFNQDGCQHVCRLMTAWCWSRTSWCAGYRSC